MNEDMNLARERFLKYSSVDVPLETFTDKWISHKDCPTIYIRDGDLIPPADELEKCGCVVTISTVTREEYERIAG